MSKDWVCEYRWDTWDYECVMLAFGVIDANDVIWLDWDSDDDPLLQG